MTAISCPNMVWVTALGSASMALVTPKMLPVMTLMRANASTAAKAPPARSFAQLPPMATANRMCRLLITAQPIFSIVSFNNSLFSRITSPQLTTVDVNPYQLGMEAASQTINHIENPNLLATKIIVPHKLIPRESCCPPEERH